MLRGLTRNYHCEAHRCPSLCIEKSATSERFIQASRGKLKELMERRWEN